MVALLKLQIRLDAVGGDWAWTGRRWACGASWIEPYDHPALQRLDPGRDSTAMVVRERRQGADGVPHHDDWPGDYVTVQPDADGLWLRAGALGIAPVYLIEHAGTLHGSWDIADLQLHMGAAPMDLREAARLLGMRFRYGRHTLWHGLQQLTERSHAVFNASGLRMCYPLPAVHSAAREVRAGADVLDGYEEILDAVIDQHCYSADTAAVELSGGLDSANVAVTLGRRHPGHVTASALMILEDAGIQQSHRRQDMIQVFRLGPNVTTLMRDHLPLRPGGRRVSGGAITPYDDPYDEAKTLLLSQLQQRGIRTIFTGVGGDEMVSLTSAEQPHEAFGVGLALAPWLTPTVRELLEDADTGIAPATAVNEMTLISQACASPPMLRAGIWPIHPLADPHLIRFGEWLPRAWRERKRLHRARLERIGCSDELLNPPLPENFAPVMRAGLRRYGLPYLRAMLKTGSILIDQGLIDSDGLAVTVDRLSCHDFDPRDTELYGVVAVEAALRAFRRGGYATASELLTAGV